jgi:hypothetical protein
MKRHEVMKKILELEGNERRRVWHEYVHDGYNNPFCKFCRDRIEMKKKEEVK